MSDPGRRIPKITVEVELTLSDGSRQRGMIFISATQRVSDLLNAPEPYFAFRPSDDRDVLLINKSAVAMVKPLDQRG